MAALFGTHVNKIDKKGRVSVPKPFRDALSEQNFDGVHIFPSFKYPAIEALSEPFFNRVIANLEKRLEPSATPEEDAPVRAAWRYLSNRIDYLDYPKALAAGLPIGTGMIESANGHVIQDRLKGRGMAWLPDNAQAIAQARCLCASGRWEQYWQKSEKAAA